MKKSLVAFAALFALAAAGFAAFSALSSRDASARSIRIDYLESALRDFRVDPKLPGAQNTVGGTVRVSYESNTVQLRLLQQQHCEPGMLCAAVMPYYYEVTLPIVDQTTDRCGNVKYIALRDGRPVDGVLEHLTVTNTMNNRCPHLIMLAPTLVEYQTRGYSRMTAEERSTHSFFAGDALSP